MKLILSRHYTPSSHWTQWPEENFDFTEYSQPWEHPGVSRLAYETKATYKDLDADGDCTLRSFVSHYWAPDIASRRGDGDLSDALVDMGQELVELNRIKHQLYSGSLDSESIPQDWREDMESREIDEKEGKIGNHDDIIEYLNIYLKPRCEVLWKEIIKLIIKERYVTNHDFLLRTVTNDMWLEMEKEYSSHFPDLVTDAHKDEFFQDMESNFENWAKSESYHAAIIAYPGYNLLSYFHDEIVFQCYIQMFVMHGRESLDNGGIRVVENTETEYVTSRILLDTPCSITDEDIDTLLNMSHGWWS